MQNWRTVKLFLSSTFTDLEQERDEMAKIFRHIQKEMLSHQIHFMVYDMRWQEQHDHNLVRWCLSALEQCDYFIGILGDRYGWSPENMVDGQKNQQNISITEMEIRYALENIPSSQRFFLLRSKESSLAIKNENSPQLESLKKYLEKQNEKIFFYTEKEEIASIVCQKLQPALLSPSQSSSNKINPTSQMFVGRAEVLKTLHQFTNQPVKKNLLVVVGDAGIGKSALAAQFRQSLQNTKSLILSRFVSSGDTPAIIFQDIGKQISSHIDIGKLEKTPEKLREQLQKWFRTTNHPVVLILDGLDQVSAQVICYWLPIRFSPTIRVVLTSRPGENLEEFMTNRLDYQKLLLNPLTEKDAQEFVQVWQEQHNITVQEKEIEELLQRSSCHPLYLKVALEEFIAGGTATGQLAQSVESLFFQIIERLQSKYNSELVATFLGLIAASREGIAETELREILIERFGREQEWQILAVGKSLATFLRTQDGLLHFFHREFLKSIKMFLGRTQIRNAHRDLATFFQQQLDFYERSLLELPFHLLWSENYEQWIQLFTSLNFLEKKCQADLPQLLVDIQSATNNVGLSLPANLTIEIYPGVSINKQKIQYLQRVLERNFNFLSQNPTEMFSCLWNHCYWHDGNIGAFYTNKEDTAPSMSCLAEYWKNEKKQQGANSFWLQSLRPYPERLDSSLTRTWYHLGVVRCFAQHKHYLAMGNQDGSIQIWHLQANQLWQTLQGHTEVVTSILFVTDDFLVSASFDCTIRVWDLKLEECIQTWHGHMGKINNLALDPEGKYIASASNDGSIKIWEFPHGNCIQTFSLPNGPVKSIAWNQDYLVSAGHEEKVYLWNLNECIGQISAINGFIDTIALKDHLLAIGGSSKIVQIWNLESNEKISEFSGHEGAITHLLWEENNLISSSWDNTICVWNTIQQKLESQLSSHNNIVTSMKFDATQRNVYSASLDTTVKICDLQKTTVSPILHSHKRKIEALKSSGNRVLSWGEDKVCKVWNTKGYLEDTYLRITGGDFETFYISKNGQRVVTAGGVTGNSIKVWDLEKKQEFDFSQSKGRITSIAINEEGTLLFIGYLDKTIQVWDCSRGEVIRSLSGHEGAVCSLTLNQDNQLLISGSLDKTIRLWDWQKGECIQVLHGHQDRVVYLEANQNQLLSGSWDKSVRIWDIKSGRCLEALVWKDINHINQVAVSLEHPYYILVQKNETEVRCRKNRDLIFRLPFVFSHVEITGSQIICGSHGQHLYMFSIEDLTSDKI